MSVKWPSGLQWSGALCFYWKRLHLGICHFV